MAGIETSGKNGRRRLPRPDMTAMVDVAFLLLMFFVLTASVVQPKAMNFYAPADGPNPPINCNKLLSIYLLSGDRIVFTGDCTMKTEETHFGDSGLRRMLNQKLNENPEIVIVVKPHDKSRYRNLVDALDELVIAGAPRYVVGDFTEADHEIMKQNSIQGY